MSDYSGIERGELIEEIYRKQAENEQLRAALTQVISSLETLGEDGWSDAPYLLRACRKALKIP
jgi:hypothetical protein